MPLDLPTEIKGPSAPAQSEHLNDRWFAPMGTRELLTAWVCLALLSIPVFLPHILHGGLYLDDWVGVANAVHPSPGGGLWSTISNEVLASGRPVFAVFLPVKYFVLGTHVKLILIQAIGLAVLAALLTYAVLRVLTVPWYHAWLISALTLAYPWYDSTRFWDSASPISLAIVLALAGLWMALIGLFRDSWRLHGGAALLYLLSMLTYEITLPFIAAAGLLYTVRNGWRAARLRWGVDLAMVLIAGVWIRTHTPKAVSGLSGDLSHLHQIFTQGGELLARTVFPVGAQPHTSMMLYALAFAFAVGLAIYLLQPADHRSQSVWGLRGWLLLGAGGLLVAALGWAIFIPADPYYSPSIFGVTNRVNGFAGFGLILAAYAALGIAGSIAGLVIKERAWLPAAVTISLALMLGAAYLHVLERHGRLWSDAYGNELAVSERMHSALPHMPNDTTVFASSYPANVTLGVPIFTATWDLAGMTRLTYGNPTLRAYPITEVLSLECLMRGVRISEAGIPTARYGTARLLDLQTGRVSKPLNRQECLADKPAFPPGPLYLTTGY